MKWTGQNIENFISRFQQKVYLESANIEIRKVSGQPTLELSAWSTTATSAHAGRIKFLKSGTATVDTYTAGNHTTAGEILGRIEAYGIDDGDGETLSSYIEFANDAVSDADSSPGKIVFATSDADDAGTPTVRLTIDDDGLAAFVGAISVGGNLTFDSVALTGIQTSAETFNDDDVSVMTSAAIEERISTVAASLITAEDLDLTADSGTAAVDLNSQALAVTGGTNCTTSATGQAVTINVDDAFIKNDADDVTGGALEVRGAAGITIKDGTASSATEGGNLVLASDDGAVMADNHRLGVIEFKGAEDTSNTLTNGARIQAIADATWSASENGASLQFYTTDGNASESVVLTLDSDKKATFAGDLTVNGDNVLFESANADDPIVTIKNTSNAANDMASLKFVKDRGAAPGVGDNLAEIYFIGEDADQNSQEYGRILCETDVVTGGQESGVLKFGVANHDGGNGYGLTLTGGSANNEIDINIGLGTASVTTVAGDLTVTGSDLTFDSVALTAIQASGESFVDNDTSLMTSAAINDRINKRTTRVYGDTIKLIPSDFVINDDVANKTIQFDNTGTTGLKPGAAGSELWAFMDIPEGKKATHVDVYANVDRTIGVYDIEIDASGIGTAKGVGTSNTQLDFTDVDATATNYLGIYIITASTNDRIYGGLLTIADQ